MRCGWWHRFTAAFVLFVALLMVFVIDFYVCVVAFGKVLSLINVITFLNCNLIFNIQNMKFIILIVKNIKFLIN